jgi:DNA-binding LytR/AlgR family response regulator
MEVKALFLGFSRRRVKSLVESIEKGAVVSIEATTRKEVSEESEALGGDYDILFLDRKLGDRKLGSLLRRMRRRCETPPAVLVYETEPDGKAFAIASEHDCLLYSEKDRLKRGLSPTEIGEAIEAELDAPGIERRLMEVSLSSGPCSTGR